MTPAMPGALLLWVFLSSRSPHRRQAIPSARGAPSQGAYAQSQPFNHVSVLASADQALTVLETIVALQEALLGGPSQKVTVLSVLCLCHCCRTALLSLATPHTCRDTASCMHAHPNWTDLPQARITLSTPSACPQPQQTQTQGHRRLG